MYDQLLLIIIAIVVVNTLVMIKYNIQSTILWAWCKQSKNIVTAVRAWHYTLFLMTVWNVNAELMILIKRVSIVASMWYRKYQELHIVRATGRGYPNTEKGYFSTFAYLLNAWDMFYLRVAWFVIYAIVFIPNVEDE